MAAGRSPAAPVHEAALASLPSPALSRAIARLTEVANEAAEVFLADPSHPDADHLSSLSSGLRLVRDLILESREPGMVLTFGGVDDGRGFCLSVHPKDFQARGRVLPFVPRPAAPSLPASQARLRLLPGGAR